MPLFFVHRSTNIEKIFDLLLDYLCIHHVEFALDVALCGLKLYIADNTTYITDYINNSSNISMNNILNNESVYSTALNSFQVAYKINYTVHIMNQYVKSQDISSLSGSALLAKSIYTHFYLYISTRRLLYM